MALSSSSWNSTLHSNLVALSWTGSNLSTFSNAAAAGSVAGIIGAPFVTTDTGLITATSPAAGIGTGITGISPTTLASNIYSECVSSFGQAGINLLKMCTAMATAAVTELAKATLTSVHNTVFSGSGTVNPGSVIVLSSTISALMFAAAPTFVGVNWLKLCNAYATALANQIQLAGTGTVTITGVGFPGIPGAGVSTSGIVS